MASKNSSNGILMAGTALGLVILAAGWWYAASEGANAERSAMERGRAALALMQEDAAEAASSAAEAVSETAGNAAEAVSDAATTAVAAVSEVASDVAETVEDAVEGTEETVEAAAETAEETAEATTEAAEETAEAAVAAVTETAEATEEAAADATETVVAAAESAEETVTETAESVSDEATEVAAGAQVAMANAAKAMSGVADGDAGAAGQIVVPGDPHRGERVFRRCSACHEVGEGAGNGVGPHLNDIVGREAGSVEGFNYSQAMAASGEVWTPQALTGYLTDPDAVVEGAKSAFPGLRNENDKGALIAYLATYSAGATPVALVQPVKAEAPQAEVQKVVAVATEDAAAASSEEISAATAEVGEAVEAATEEAVEVAAVATEEAATEEAASEEAATEEAASEEAASEEAATEETASEEAATEEAASEEAATEEAASEEAATEEAATETAVAALPGDADKGAKVFRKCKACHMVGDAAKNRTGPQLNGIIDRPIAGIDGFKYSKVLAAAGEEGKTWTVEELTAFLKKPKAAYKGSKMAFAGLRKDADLENVIAYLATFE